MAETQVLVDALPYIDQGYDDTGVREMVTAMVEEETRYFKEKVILAFVTFPNHKNALFSDDIVQPKTIWKIYLR